MFRKLGPCDLWIPAPGSGSGTGSAGMTGQTDVERICPVYVSRQLDHFLRVESETAGLCYFLIPDGLFASPLRPLPHANYRGAPMWIADACMPLTVICAMPESSTVITGLPGAHFFVTKLYDPRAISQ
jgi:hypothetical protein